MTSLLEAESQRLAAQQRLDQLKTRQERNRWGQFATPPALALDIARLAWNQLKGRRGTWTFLDPALGTGAFFSAFLQAFPAHRVARATGVELDAPFAQAARELWGDRGLEVVPGDFTKQTPTGQYNVLLANPPYVRHHHLSRAEKRRLGQLAQEVTGLQLSGLAGLYCYFLLIAHRWLAENGLAAWLVPAEFLDVNYGAEVKRYLTEQVCLLQVHRFCPADVQFEDALVSSAVVVFKKRRARPGHTVAFSRGGALTAPAEIQQVALDKLQVTGKWGALPQSSRVHRAARVTLGELFTVKRGLATGNNAFFIVECSRLEELGVPIECARPILPSPRYLRPDVIEPDAAGWPILERQLALIDCRLAEDEVARRWPRFAAYLAAGRHRGICDGYLASRRSPWYTQESREPAPFLCTYMGRNPARPFRFLWNRSAAVAANVYLLLYPQAGVAEKVSAKAAEVFAALQAIAPELLVREGRVYGGGLHKLEPAELLRLPADRVAEILAGGVLGSASP